MAKHTFGTPISDDEVMVLQGVEYHLQPVGMRMMRKMFANRAALEEAEKGSATVEQVDMLIDVVADAVVPAERDRLREHIDESVDAPLLAEVATAVLRGFADVDPTQPTSSSDGSSGTGPTSTGGVVPEVLTPST